LTCVSKRLELSLLVIVGLSVFNSIPRARIYGSTWEVPGEERSLSFLPCHLNASIHPVAWGTTPDALGNYARWLGELRAEA
jgi:hypothetical protein